MNQCYELKLATADIQTIFLFYMIIKLIQQDVYLDEIHVKEILQQEQINVQNEKLYRMNRFILRYGFLTFEQKVQSATKFFLQDVRHALKTFFLIIKYMYIKFHLVF